MKIWIDTREQIPLEFKAYDIVTEVFSSKLEVGDYAIQFKNGFVPSIRFERKSVGDLFGTLGKGHERFDREIERAKMFEVKLVILIEGTLTKVSKGYEHSSLKGDTVLKMLFSLWERYDVLPVFCKDRDECSRFIVEVGSAIGRKAIRDIKEGKHEIHK